MGHNAGIVTSSEVCILDRADPYNQLIYWPLVRCTFGYTTITSNLFLLLISVLTCCTFSGVTKLCVSSVRAQFKCSLLKGLTSSRETGWTQFKCSLGTSGTQIKFPDTIRVQPFQRTENLQNHLVQCLDFYSNPTCLLSCIFYIY